MQILIFGTDRIVEYNKIKYVNGCGVETQQHFVQKLLYNF